MKTLITLLFITTLCYSQPDTSKIIYGKPYYTNNTFISYYNKFDTIPCILVVTDTSTYYYTDKNHDTIYVIKPLYDLKIIKGFIVNKKYSSWNNFEYPKYLNEFKDEVKYIV